MSSESITKEFLNRLLEKAEKGSPLRYDAVSRRLDLIVARFQPDDLKRLERICQIGYEAIKMSQTGSKSYQARAGYVALRTRADHAINGPPSRRKVS